MSVESGHKVHFSFIVLVLFLALYFALILVYFIMKESMKINSLGNKQTEELKNSTHYFKCAALASSFFMMAFLNAFTVLMFMLTFIGSGGIILGREHSGSC